MSVTQTKAKRKKLSSSALLHLLWSILPQLLLLLNDNRDVETPVILEFDYTGGKTLNVTSHASKGEPIEVVSTPLKYV